MMDAIYHEKQDSVDRCCAVHCLNTVLQGPYYNAVDLAQVAHALDNAERKHLHATDVEQQSNNVSDTGFFSIQVLSGVLLQWCMELVPYNSCEPRAVAARSKPHLQYAFICHYQQHWFTLRRIGDYWYNLNSLLQRPVPMSDTYLALYLAQLQHQQYSIFIVCSQQQGESPNVCPSPGMASGVGPGTWWRRDELFSSESSQKVTVDEDLLKAIELSLSDAEPSVNENISQCESNDLQDSDSDLEKAIALSLQVENESDDQEPSSSTNGHLISNSNSHEHNYINNSPTKCLNTGKSDIKTISEVNNPQPSASKKCPDQNFLLTDMNLEEDEQAELSRALALSLECVEEPL